VSKLKKKGEARSISLRVRITPSLLRELKQLAEQDRRTVSNFVCALLERYVDTRIERPSKR
jgi:mRNA-degrading endonuclease RelE of RelBE toxin-antitoxin system